MRYKLAQDLPCFNFGSYIYKNYVQGSISDLIEMDDVITNKI